MNAEETMRVLLVVVGSQGRSEVPPAMALAWTIAFEEVAYEVAMAGAREALKRGDVLREPRDLKRHTDPLMRHLAMDVKSAKIRGLVPDTWSKTRPLPTAVAERLRAEWAGTNDSPEVIEGSVGTDLARPDGSIR